MSKRTSVAFVLAWASAATLAQAEQVTHSTPYTPGLPATVVNSQSLTLNAASPVFRRPTAAGTELSPTVPTTLATAGNYPYATSTFTPETEGLYDFFSAQAFDGYLFLYGSFDPANPLDNVLAGDDDMGTLNGGSVPNRNGVTGSSDSGFRYFLISGFTYTLVSTTFSATVPANGAVYNEIRSLPTPAEPSNPIPDGVSSTVPGEPFSLDLVISSEDTRTIQSMDNLKIFSLAHSWVSDLVITLTHVESGTTVDILDRAGKTTATSVGNSDDLNGDYTFVDGGPPLNIAGTVIPGGTYGLDPNTAFGSSTADGTLSSFVGLPIAGTWRLTFVDYFPADIGTVSAFSITATLNDSGPAIIAGDFGGGESPDGSLNTPDGAFNEFDVEGFLLALNDEAAYLVLNPTLGSSLIGRGDFGGNESTDGSLNTPDGAFNEFDVEGFLLALNDPEGYAAIQPGGRIAPIPEPAALGLLAPMGLLLSRRRR